MIIFLRIIQIWAMLQAGTVLLLVVLVWPIILLFAYVAVAYFIGKAIVAKRSNAMMSRREYSGYIIAVTAGGVASIGASYWGASIANLDTTGKLEVSDLVIGSAVAVCITVALHIIGYKIQYASVTPKSFNQTDVISN